MDNEIKLYDIGFPTFSKRIRDNFRRLFEIPDDIFDMGYMRVPDIDINAMGKEAFEKHMKVLKEKHPDATIKGYYYSYRNEDGEPKEETIEFESEAIE